jgi:hypothetical protein
MAQTKNSFRMWRKEKWLLTRYYLRSFRRRVPSTPLVLFAISFALFAIVMWPNLRSRLRGSDSKSATAFHVFGLISEEVKNQNSISYKPAQGAMIEVGGARTFSGADGTYDIEFPSSNHEGVPIIFRYGERELLERISLSPGQDRIRKDLVFR